MRPIANTDVPVDVRARRQDKWWRTLFVTVMFAQIVMVMKFDLSFWWAIGSGLAAFALFEGVFWLLDRKNESLTGGCACIPSELDRKC